MQNGSDDGQTSDGGSEAGALIVDEEGNTERQAVTFTVEEEQGSADAPGFGALESVLVIRGAGSRPEAVVIG